MQPLSFDPTTAREIVGDAYARTIEAKARADADAQTYQPPKVAGATYWTQVTAQMEAIVYRQQYEKRAARNKRKAA